MQKVKITEGQLAETFSAIHEAAVNHYVDEEVRNMPFSIGGQEMLTDKRQWQAYINSEFAHLNSLMNLVIGAVNTIAGKAVIDALGENDAGFIKGLHARADLDLEER